MSLATRSAFPDSTREVIVQQHKNRTRPNHTFVLRTDRHLDHAVPVFAKGAVSLSDLVERAAMRQPGGEINAPASDHLTSSLSRPLEAQGAGVRFRNLARPRLGR